MMTAIRKQLQVGQTVRVEHQETGCQVLTVLPAGQTGLQVTEVGVDYLVLEDAAEGVRTRLPMHIIKSVNPLPSPEPQAA